MERERTGENEPDSSARGTVQRRHDETQQEVAAVDAAEPLRRVAQLLFRLGRAAAAAPGEGERQCSEREGAPNHGPDVVVTPPVVVGVVVVVGSVVVVPVVVVDCSVVVGVDVVVGAGAGGGDCGFPAATR